MHKERLKKSSTSLTQAKPKHIYTSVHTQRDATPILKANESGADEKKIEVSEYF